LPDDGQVQQVEPFEQRREAFGFDTTEPAGDDLNRKVVGLSHDLRAAPASHVTY
jgi:hypothetical protein